MIQHTRKVASIQKVQNVKVRQQ